MRCMCCNTIMPPATIYRSILISHPTEKNKTTTLRVEEDFCSRCANKSQYHYVNSEDNEEDVISGLGLNLPEVNRYEY